MYQFFLMTSLYSVGIVIGFLLIPFFTRVPLDEKAGIDMDAHFDQLFLSYKFVDEVEEAPQSELTTEELGELRDKRLTYEIPFLKQTVLMYYDDEKKTFCYYSQSNLIYKYLMVVARKYVLEFHCKQIFKEMVPSMKKEEKTVQFSAFVKKTGKTVLEKEMNTFLYMGNLADSKPAIEKPKEINYADYWKMCQLQSSVQEEISSSPEIQSTDSD